MTIEKRVLNKCLGKNNRNTEKGEDYSRYHEWNKGDLVEEIMFYKEKYKKSQK